MNVRTILRQRTSWFDRFIDGLRPLDGVGRLRDVWFGWLFEHPLTTATCLPHSGTAGR